MSTSSTSSSSSSSSSGSSLSKSPHPIIIGIDLGTAGCGMSFVHRAHPTNIQADQTDPGGGHKIRSDLYIRTEDGKVVERDLGERAFAAYQTAMTALSRPGTTKRSGLVKCYLFRRFKMSLYSASHITQDMVIKDTSLQELPAITVFGEALRVLKDRALERARMCLGGCLESQVQWVLTVPAIWSEPAKNLMRESAIYCGLCTRENPMKVIFALEPEAASLACRGEFKTSTGDVYEIVDCGGGTIDITVHEVLPDGALREVCRAGGNNMGSTAIDVGFARLLREVFGEDVMNAFCSSYPVAYNTMTNEFERIKHAFQPGRALDMQIKLAPKFMQLVMDVTGRSPAELAAAYTEGGVSIEEAETGDVLVLDEATVLSLFRPVTAAVVAKAKEMKERADAKGKPVTTILVVGGFAKCDLLMAEFRKVWGDTVKSPKQADLQVLTGACMYGINEQSIATRVMHATIGIQCQNPYTSEHAALKRPYRMQLIEGKEVKYCQNIFNAFVRKDQEVTCGKPYPQECTFPFESGLMEIPVFATDLLDPRWTDETGVGEPLGTLVCPVAMPSKEKKKRGALIEFVFGSTELLCRSTDLISGATYTLPLTYIRPGSSSDSSLSSRSKTESKSPAKR